MNALSPRAQAQLVAIGRTVARAKRAAPRSSADTWLQAIVDELGVPAGGSHLLELCGIAFGTAYLARRWSHDLETDEDGERLTLVGVRAPWDRIYLHPNGALFMRRGRRWQPLAPSVATFLERITALPAAAPFWLEVPSRRGDELAEHLGVPREEAGSAEDTAVWCNERWFVANGLVDEPGAPACHVRGVFRDGTRALGDALAILGLPCVVRSPSSAADVPPDDFPSTSARGRVALAVAGDRAGGSIDFGAKSITQWVWDEDHRVVEVSTFTAGQITAVRSMSAADALADRLSTRARTYLERSHAVRDPRDTCSSSMLASVLAEHGRPAHPSVLAIEEAVGGVRIGEGIAGYRFGPFQLTQLAIREGLIVGAAARPDLVVVGAFGEVGLLRGADDLIYAYNRDTDVLRPVSTDPIALIEALALEREHAAWRARSLSLAVALEADDLTALGAEREEAPSCGVCSYARGPELLVLTTLFGDEKATRIMAPSADPLRGALRVLHERYPELEVRASHVAYTELHDAYPTLQRGG